MFLENSFGKTLDITHRALDVAQLRNSVIANNIANSDTPNFKRTTVSFESQLKRALASEQRDSIPAALTNERHIPFHRPMEYRQVYPIRNLDYLTTSKNNGNNVDIEEESVALIQNQLRYNLMVQSLQNQFSRVGLVLR
jgi:flagellar basal-body rod protein FlgB